MILKVTENPSTGAVEQPTLTNTSDVSNDNTSDILIGDLKCPMPGDYRPSGLQTSDLAEHLNVTGNVEPTETIGISEKSLPVSEKPKSPSTRIDDSTKTADDGSVSSITVCR